MTSLWPEIDLSFSCHPTQNRNHQGVLEWQGGRRHSEAIQVDLLFLDIQMPGGGGFDVIEAIGLANMPMTVFVNGPQRIRGRGVRSTCVGLPGEAD